MLMEITTELTLDAVNKIPEFSGFADYIAPSAEAAGQFASTPFSNFAALGWNPASICDGYNHLLEICREGFQVFYPLWTETDLQETPALRERFLIHFPVKKKTPFLILCAGGAYQGCASMIEGYPTCHQLNELGYHVFTLNYRAGVNATAPNPMDDLAFAVSYILEHADELNVERENYVIGGFSAGGHLAACFGTESLGWKHYGLPRPGAMFLAYPVITMGEKTHALSRDTLLGADAAQNPELLFRYSAEKQVTAQYPPTFLWQCAQDYEVPIENSQMMAEALSKHKVPHIYETFDSNAHGWGSGDGTLADGWVKRAVKFWQENIVKSKTPPLAAEHQI